MGDGEYWYEYISKKNDSNFIEAIQKSDPIILLCPSFENGLMWFYLYLYQLVD